MSMLYVWWLNGLTFEFTGLRGFSRRFGEMMGWASRPQCIKHYDALRFLANQDSCFS